MAVWKRRTMALISTWMVLLCSGITLRGIVAQDCVGQADIVFMVDSSRSILENSDSKLADNNWDLMKQFLNKIVDKLPLEQDDVRIGLVKFATTVEEHQVIQLKGYSNKQDLKRKITDLSFMAGNTNTSGALRYMRNDVFGGRYDREYVMNYGILITDGLSNVDMDLTIPEARSAKSNGNIRLFTVGITKYANTGELEEIASDPVPYHYFFTEDFRSLSLLVDQLLNKLCKTNPPPPTPCKDTRADLTFLLDSSGSIRQKNPDNFTDNWELIKDFVVDTIESLDVRLEHTRVAVVRFSGVADVVFHLNEFPDNRGMAAKIMELKYLDSTTNTSGALEVMRTKVFQRDNGDRPDIRNVGIIIADGESNVDVNRTYIEADRVKRQGIRMFAIGLTSSIDVDELTTIASEPTESHFFTAEEISGVEKFRSQLIWGICNDNCGPDQDENAECWRDVAALGCEPDENPTWKEYPGHILVGYNYARLQGIDNAQHCKSLCLQDPKCKSVDYVPAYRECAVSYITKDEAPGSFEAEPGADYYELHCDGSSRDSNPVGGGSGGSGGSSGGGGSGGSGGSSGGGGSGGSGGSGGGTGGVGTTKKPSSGPRHTMSWILLITVQAFWAVRTIQQLA